MNAIKHALNALGWGIGFMSVCFIYGFGTEMGKQTAKELHYSSMPIKF